MLNKVLRILCSEQKSYGWLSSLATVQMRRQTIEHSHQVRIREITVTGMQRDHVRLN